MKPADILRMIETVSPDDTGKLDEIDARVWCYIEGITFTKPKYFSRIDKQKQVRGYGTKEIGDISKFCTPCIKDRNWTSRRLKFTRSRDALKGIRVNGYEINIYSMTVGFCCRLRKGGNAAIEAVNLTEELAELHAIIQAIAYERGGE